MSGTLQPDYGGIKMTTHDTEKSVKVKADSITGRYILREILLDVEVMLDLKITTEAERVQNELDGSLSPEEIQMVAQSVIDEYLDADDTQRPEWITRPDFYWYAINAFLDSHSE